MIPRSEKRPAETDQEAIEQILSFEQRQFDDARQQREYAIRQLQENGGTMLDTNREYYESEAERCTNRMDFFRPRLGALWKLYASEFGCENKGPKKSFCNKCDFFGYADENGNHRRPRDGKPCHYLAPPMEFT